MWEVTIRGASKSPRLDNGELTQHRYSLLVGAILTYSRLPEHDEFAAPRRHPRSGPLRPLRSWRPPDALRDGGCMARQRLQSELNIDTNGVHGGSWWHA